MQSPEEGTYLVWLKAGSERTEVVVGDEIRKRTRSSCRALWVIVSSLIFILSEMGKHSWILCV